VAGLIDEIGMVDILNKKLGIDPREKVSTGVIAKAMILNGLGFVSAPLYLFGQFFQGKATEQLLGEGIKRRPPGKCPRRSVCSRTERTILRN
jgi:transposase